MAAPVESLQERRKSHRDNESDHLSPWLPARPCATTESLPQLNGQLTVCFAQIYTKVQVRVQIFQQEFPQPGQRHKVRVALREHGRSIPGHRRIFAELIKLSPVISA